MIGNEDLCLSKIRKDLGGNELYCSPNSLLQCPLPPRTLITLGSILRSRLDLPLEILALRHQIGVLERSVHIAPPSAWNTEKRAFIEILLRDLLKTKPEPGLVDVVMEKLSAVVEFTMFVLHAFLTGNYSIEKNSSDVFDQFQLRYLAKDRFVIVTGDPDLSNRTVPSSQAHRVMTLHDFLQTL